MAHILVVDDEANLRKILRSLLRSDGHEVAEATGLRDARAALSGNIFDLVLTDQKMQDGEGLELLAFCRDVDPTLPVVFLTAFATVELAVEAMRAGAFDFIPKPFVPDHVLMIVRRACERTELSRENLLLRRSAPDSGGRSLIGDSEAMSVLRDLVSRVAPTNATVLIVGETGSGKELVARSVHAASPRSRKPFIAVNCAAVTETLLESELFGHERGAFTGADRPRQGLFEAAHGGTLFLDEASEMSPSLQAKLLRVLVDGDVVRVGSTQPRRIDARVIVATNRDLPAMVKEGTFREDLYYRLAVVPIEVPPLRQRLQDVPILAEFFVRQAVREMNARPVRLSEEAVQHLCSYAFPGNVRELRNLIERAVILARSDCITPEDLPLRSNQPPWNEALDRLLQSLPPGLELHGVMREFESMVIRRSLERANGVQAAAARDLGVSRSLIGYKLRKLNRESDDRLK
ncbi:MAG: sigma-54 dependent transcriptional regulator [Thermoanaerobaculia bacterium]